MWMTKFLMTVGNIRHCFFERSELETRSALVVKTEILAHAIGALSRHPQAQTILDIGGIYHLGSENILKYVPSWGKMTYFEAQKDSKFVL